MKSNLLVAKKGMVFTDGTTYGKQIRIAKGENPDNYREITIEEYETITEQSDENEGVVL